MGRRRKEVAGISLFPFLSILCCVIGVLTLMIAAVALGQIDSNKDEKIEIALQYQDLTKKNEQTWEKVKNLNELAAEAAAIREKLEQARQELKRLKNEEQQFKSKKKTADKLEVKLLADSSAARKRIEKLSPELKDLQEEIAKLKVEVVQRKKDNLAKVLIKPGGSGVGLLPAFVECTKNDVVIHGKEEKTRIRRGDLSKSKKFHDLLLKVKSIPNAIVVFLIRDDGVDTYRTARNIARVEYVNNGKLAVIGQGEIDLSFFKGKN